MVVVRNQEGFCLSLLPEGLKPTSGVLWMHFWRADFHPCTGWVPDNTWKASPYGRPGKTLSTVGHHIWRPCLAIRQTWQFHSIFLLTGSQTMIVDSELRKHPLIDGERAHCARMPQQRSFGAKHGHFSSCHIWSAGEGNRDARYLLASSLVAKSKL